MLRNRRFDRRQERPVLARVGRRRFIRRFCALVDPGGQLGDFFGCKGCAVVFGRHPPAVGAGNGLDQQALLALARHDRRSLIAALANGRGRVEPQRTLLLQRPMAGAAALSEDRLDLLEIIDLVRSQQRACEQQPADQRTSGLRHGRPLENRAGRRASPDSSRRADGQRIKTRFWVSQYSRTARNGSALGTGGMDENHGGYGGTDRRSRIPIRHAATSKLRFPGKGHFVTSFSGNRAYCPFPLANCAKEGADAFVVA